MSALLRVYFVVFVDVVIVGTVACGSGSKPRPAFDASTSPNSDGDLSDGNLFYPDGGSIGALVPCRWNESLATVETNEHAETGEIRQFDHTLSVLYSTKRLDAAVVAQRTINETATLGSESIFLDGYSLLSQPRSVTGKDGKQIFAFIGTYFNSRRVYTRYYDGNEWSDAQVQGIDTGPALMIEAASLKDGSFALAWSSQQSTPTVQPKKLFFATLDTEGALKQGPTEVPLVGQLVAFTLAKGEDSALVVSVIKEDSSHAISVQPINGSTGHLTSTVTEVPRESTDPVAAELSAVRTSSTSTMVGWTELANGTTPRGRLRNIHDGAESDDHDILRQLYPAATTRNVTLLPFVSFVVAGFEAYKDNERTLNLQIFYPFGDPLTDMRSYALNEDTQVSNLRIQSTLDLSLIGLIFSDFSAAPPIIYATTAWCVE